MTSPSPCKHGTQPLVMSDKTLPARSVCEQCKWERKASAKKAALTRKATGNMWSRAFIIRDPRTFRRIPRWLVAKDEVYGDWVVCNNRIVYTAARSPVWIVDVQTYRMEELLDLDRLKDLLRGRTGLGHGDTPLFSGLAVLTIAPQSAIDEGEDLEEYGLVTR